MIKSLQIARDIFEKQYPEYAQSPWLNERSEYVDLYAQKYWTVFLAGFELAWNETKPSQYEDSTGNVIWDLDVSAWESIKQSALDSKWIPEEYFMNDWTADVRQYLIEGKCE